MNKTLPVFLFIISVGAVLYGQLLIALIFSTWFSYLVSAIWLVPVAFLIDGYFGTFHEVPTLTITAIILFLLTELARPHFAWHTDEVL